MLLAFSIFALGSCTASLESFDDEDQISGNTNPGNSQTPNNENVDNQSDIALSRLLTCESVSLCTNFAVPHSPVNMPFNRGGVIEDGLYLVEEGQAEVEAFYFENGSYSRIWSYLGVSYGNFSTEDNLLVLELTNSCSSESVNPASISLETFKEYSVVGDELYLKKDCGRFACDGDAVKFRRVRSLCGLIENYSCQGGDCECSQFVETPVPTPVNLAAGCDIE